MKNEMRIKPVAILVAILVAATGVGCSNPETEAGYEGYVSQGALLGSTKFYDTQTGPTSTGLGWLLSVQNVDFRWQTYKYEFQVMSSDNLELTFTAALLIRPKPGSVREIVEIYGGDSWLERNINQPFRNAVYESVAGQKALEAKDNRQAIGDLVKEKFGVHVEGLPFEVKNITIGTINLPPIVANAQQQKIKKETELEQKEFELQTAQKDAAIRVEEAKGIAEAQDIISQSLTDQYLQYEAIRAQREMAGSPNHTTVYLPSGANGIPLVKNIQ